MREITQAARAGSVDTTKDQRKEAVTARSYHVMRRPAVTRLAEQALNPLIGKSLVVYAVKAQAGRADG